MELDLTKLKQLSGGAPGGDLAQEGTEQGQKIMQNIYNQEQEQLARSKEIYKEYQKNIRTSEQLQIEILKGAKEGEPLPELFLKAVKAISLMTSNTVFYNQLERDIKEKYSK